MTTDITIGRKCPFCREMKHIKVPADITFSDRMDAYRSGMLIQNAFPELTATQREVIKTGICEKCQALVFM